MTTTLPNIADWATLTQDERRVLIQADSDNRPKDDKEAQARFSARYKACTAILKPYIESLGQFKVIKAHKHAMRDSKDKWTHDHLVGSIVRAMVMHTWPMEVPVAQYMIDRHKAGEMIALVGCEMLRCWSCGESASIVEMTGNVLKPMQYDSSKPLGDVTHIELEDCPIDAKLPYSAEIDVPSGKMVMANHLSQLFDEIKDKYSEEKSINYLWGRKNCTLEYAKQGYIEMNIGNCSCRMYKMNKTGTKFVVGSSDCVKGRKEVANVCTDFWGYGVADLDLAMKNGLEKMQKDRPHMNFDIIPCKPGRYRFTHRYHLCREDERGIYTHVEWIKS